ncbi:MAG: DUF3892 domain-containing protein [Spirochaetales bacterium]|nr:DUF3892 domain-containing protein [Spirochaetales bacterium]
MALEIILSKVHYADGTGQLIDSCIGEYNNKTSEYKKEQIIKHIENTYANFYTTPDKSARVRVYKIKNQKFLKTENNDLEEDNLGELEKY